MALRGTLTHWKKPIRTVWRPGFFYAMKRSADGAIKFGISVNPDLRRRQIELEGRHGTVVVLWTFHAECMREVELRVHRALIKWRVETEKEWFLVPKEYPETLLVYLQRNK